MSDHETQKQAADAFAAAVKPLFEHLDAQTRVTPPQTEDDGIPADDLMQMIRNDTGGN